MPASSMYDAGGVGVEERDIQDAIYGRVLLALSEVHGDDISIYFENIAHQIRAAIPQETGCPCNQTKQSRGSGAVTRGNTARILLRKIGNAIASKLKRSLLATFIYYYIVPKMVNCLRDRRSIQGDVDSVFFSFAPNHLKNLSPIIERKAKTSVVLSAIIGRNQFKWGSGNPVLKPFLMLDGFLTYSDIARYYDRYRVAEKMCNKLADTLVSEISCAPKRARDFAHNTVMFHYMNFWRYCLIAENIVKRFASCKFYFGNDACHRSRALIEHARHACIKSVVVQHGVIANAKLYMPFADKIAVWGAVEKAKLMEYGVEGSKICVTGSPRQFGMQSAKKIALGNLTIVFATNHSIPVDMRRRMAVEVLAAAKQLGASVVIRPHPDEDPRVYEDIGAHAPDCIVDNKSSLQEQLRISCVGIITNSSVALEMALGGLLTLQFKYGGMLDDTGFDHFCFIKQVQSTADIVNVIRSASVAPESPRDRDEFIGNYLSEHGTKAIDAIIAI